MTISAFERQLAQHGAPAMAGIKPANIITFPAGTGEEGFGIRELTELYSRRFRNRDLAFRVLCECSRSCLIMVYRPSLLKKHMSGPEIRKMLEKEGYPAGGLEETLKFLSLRIRASRQQGGFPHEIGLFLGYPTEDVRGFIENRGKNYLYSCYWKVYSDVERAKAWCRRWEKVRDGILEGIDSGMRIGDMFDTEPAA